MPEKRRADRARVELNARWEGEQTSRTGTITDISRTGCFILTDDKVQVNELIRLEIQLPGGNWMSIWGEVVNRAPEIGYGLRFNGASDAEQDLLDKLIEYLIGEKTI
jgi:hypothetical protein